MFFYDIPCLLITLHQNSHEQKKKLCLSVNNDPKLSTDDHKYIQNKN